MSVVLPTRWLPETAMRTAANLPLRPLDVRSKVSRNDWRYGRQRLCPAARKPFNEIAIAWRYEHLRG
jgi:hypothetical protein